MKFKTIFKILFIYIFIVTPLFSWSHETSKCAQALNLQRTLGVEWEFSPVNIPRIQADPLLFNNAKETYLEAKALANSNFRQLFGLYGKNNQGDFIYGLIPEEISKKTEFKFLILIKGLEFEKSGNQYFIKNWQNVSAQNFMILLKTLFELRGQNSESLKLKKIPSAWSTFTNLYDSLIPDEISEEWRNGNHFVGIEFPMSGYVQLNSQLNLYIENLWLRLGLFSKTSPNISTALEYSVGHVHWVANVQSLPEVERTSIYQSIIGFWGDRNDHIFISHRNPYREHIEKYGKVQISLREASDMFRLNELNRINYSITALDQDTFLRLTATSSGVLIDNREKDLDTNVDPNFPPVFKRLPVGLRGKYGQTTYPIGTPVPTIGLEARSSQTVTEGLQHLPALLPNSDKHVNIEKLKLHNSRDPRGLLTDIPLLSANSEQLGMNSQAILELLKIVEKENYKWKPELILGETFLPLNNWLSHPVVKQKINSLPSAKRQYQIYRYQVALQEYVSRVNQLLAARKHPRSDYQPDWIDKLERFSDGYNRVYPRSQYPEIHSESGLSSDPDLWFQIILFNEMLRFVAESDLESLLDF